MRKFLLAVVAVLGISGVGYGITVNPASNALADSAATALTIIYRDASANFAANIITAVGVTLSGPMTLTSKTKAEFDSLDPAVVGEAYFCSDCTEKLICVSTGTSAAQFQRSDSESVGCGTNE